MILIFGGTTEGRHTARICDEAHKPYYYSTKGDSQQLDSMNAIRLAGALDKPSMIEVCKKQLHEIDEELEKMLENL